MRWPICEGGGVTDERRRDVHLLDEHGAVACNPRDKEAAHRADVGDIATTTDRDAVTCKRCRSLAR
ncbi:MAG TPA: hypothetical protein VGM90_19960 [Kofleriaceae bacterium]|jgi:hypothetical protein